MVETERAQPSIIHLTLLCISIHGQLPFLGTRRHRHDVYSLYRPTGLGLSMGRTPSNVYWFNNRDAAGRRSRILRDDQDTTTACGGDGAVRSCRHDERNEIESARLKLLRKRLAVFGNFAEG